MAGELRQPRRKVECSHEDCYRLKLNTNRIAAKPLLALSLRGGARENAAQAANNGSDVKGYSVSGIDNSISGREKQEEYK